MPRCSDSPAELSIMCRVIFLLCTFAVLFFSSAGEARIGARLVGGRDAEKNAYPYQASLRIRGDHKCSGSLLNRRWILTAAHCIAKYELSSFIVVLGSHNLIFGGVAFRATEARQHPNYVKTEHHDDVALVKLGALVNYTEAILPVRLPDSDVDCDKCIVTFAGWSTSEWEEPRSFNLKVIQLPVINLNECRKIFPSVTTSNICTLSSPGQGLCYGDAGGALLVDGVQIAIGSWGSPCARGYPDVHTKVYSYVDWIKPIIASESGD